MTEDPSLRANDGSARRSPRAPSPAPTRPQIQRPASQQAGFESLFSTPAGGRSSQQQPPAPPAEPPRSFRPAPGPPEERRQPGGSRLAIVAGGLVLVLVLVLAGAVFGVHRLTSGNSSLPGSGPTALPTGAQSTQPSPTASPAANVPHTGAYAKVKLGVTVNDIPDTAHFGNWLGRDPVYSVAFSPRYTWAQLADPSYLINQWRGSPYRMVYSVAMLPKHEAASFEDGAQGDYDHYYRQLAQRLVAGGQQDAIIRLGWEFNLGTSNWSTSDPKAFIAYWRHIVTAMRSVPGQKFQFDWNPNIGDTTYDATQYYPGSAYLDYVGIDVYDISWTANSYPYPANCDSDCRLTREQVVWQRLLYGTGGLAFWSQYAASKGKPMSLPEWGLWQRPDGHGGNDDPYFVKQMFAFIDDPQNHVAYQCYFDIDLPSDGKHKLTTLTNAGSTFRKLFG